MSLTVKDLKKLKELNECLIEIKTITERAKLLKKEAVLLVMGLEGGEQPIDLIEYMFTRLQEIKNEMDLLEKKADSCEETYKSIQKGLRKKAERDNSPLSELFNICKN